MCMVPGGPQDAVDFISRARAAYGDDYADILTDWFRQRFERRVNSVNEAADVYAWRSPFSVEGPRGAASGSFLATDLGSD